MALQLFLRDRNDGMVQAWKSVFAGVADVDASHGDIFAGPAVAPGVDAIVSPANSFGFMDGGIDLVYSKRFGWDLQERLQTTLRDDHDGELPVGAALVVETGDAQLPWCISAPTMRIPCDVSNTVNAYLAFRATLRAVKRHNARLPQGTKPIERVLCPGLGTAVGKMPYARCARQMHEAYRVVVLGQILAPTFLHQAHEIHRYLLD